jgi:hypothetical protein
VLLLDDVRRPSRHGPLAWLPLLLVAFGPIGQAGAQLPAGAIAFVHENTGSTDPLQQISNLRLLDARSPTTQVVLTCGRPTAGSRRSGSA